MEQIKLCVGQCYCSGKCKKIIAQDMSPYDLKGIFEATDKKDLPKDEEEESFFKPIL